MSKVQEIVTKAVIGKGKKTSSETFEVMPNEVIDNVLGCWVINHVIIFGDKKRTFISSF